MRSGDYLGGLEAILDEVPSPLDIDSLFDNSLRDVGAFNGKWEQIRDWCSWEQGFTKWWEMEIAY